MRFSGVEQDTEDLFSLASNPRKTRSETISLEKPSNAFETMRNWSLCCRAWFDVLRCIRSRKRGATREMVLRVHLQRRTKTLGVWWDDKKQRLSETCLRHKSELLSPSRGCCMLEYQSPHVPDSHSLGFSFELLFESCDDWDSKYFGGVVIGEGPTWALYIPVSRKPIVSKNIAVSSLETEQALNDYLSDNGSPAAGRTPRSARCGAGGISGEKSNLLHSDRFVSGRFACTRARKR